MVPLPLLLSSSSRRQVGGCWGMLCPWGMLHLLFFLLLSFRRSFANGVCYAPVVCYAPGVCPMLLSSFSFLFQLCDGCYQWLLVVIGGYWWLLTKGYLGIFRGLPLRCNADQIVQCWASFLEKPFL